MINTDNSDKILKDARGVSLNVSEKAAIRARLAELTLRAPSEFTPKLSPVSAVFSEKREYAMIRAWRRFVPAALVIVLTVGVGTSFAAEGALPGEPLYAVKIYINEPIETALAISAEARAEAEAAHALKRLDEAVTLAQEGKLDAVKNEAIKKHFSKNVKAMDDRIKKLQGHEEVEMSAVNSKFETALVERSDVLVSVVEDISPKAAVRLSQVVVPDNAAVEITVVSENSASTSLEISVDVPGRVIEGGRTGGAEKAEEMRKVRVILDKIRQEEKEERMNERNERDKLRNARHDEDL